MIEQSEKKFKRRLNGREEPAKIKKPKKIPEESQRRQRRRRQSRIALPWGTRATRVKGRIAPPWRTRATRDKSRLCGVKETTIYRSQLPWAGRACRRKEIDDEKKRPWLSLSKIFREIRERAIQTTTRKVLFFFCHETCSSKKKLLQDLCLAKERSH